MENIWWPLIINGQFANKDIFDDTDFTEILYLLRGEGFI